MPAPKAVFLQSQDKRKAHTELVNPDAFEQGVIFALADYSADCPSSEQLLGVSRFLDRFIHLAEKDEERTDTYSAPRLIPPEMLVPTKP